MFYVFWERFDKTIFRVVSIGIKFDELVSIIAEKYNLGAKLAWAQSKHRQLDHPGCFNNFKLNQKFILIQNPIQF